MFPLTRRFRDSQVVIITNFIVVSSVGIKGLCVVYANHLSFGSFLGYIMFPFRYKYASLYVLLCGPKIQNTDVCF